VVKINRQEDTISDRQVFASKIKEDNLLTYFFLHFLVASAIVVFVFNRKRNMSGVNCYFPFPLPASCPLAVRNNLK
jgi:hypothetical protein